MDLNQEGTAPVTRAHFPKVVGLRGTLPNKIYTQRADLLRRLFLIWTMRWYICDYMTHTKWYVVSSAEITWHVSVWAWFVALLVELCVPMHSMPSSFLLHRWCPPACMKSHPLLHFVFASLFHLTPSLYPHRNVWYVAQQTGCVIFLLSCVEMARRGRGGEKQPRCRLNSCILHHLSSNPTTIIHLTYFKGLSPQCH